MCLLCSLEWPCIWKFLDMQHVRNISKTVTDTLKKQHGPTLFSVYRYMIYLGPLAFLLHVFEQRQMMPWCLLFWGCRSGLNLRRDLSWSSSARDALPCHPTVVVWADSTLNFRWNCPANARDAGVGLDTAGQRVTFSNTAGSQTRLGMLQH